jgi:hypothetical protein
MQKIEIKKTRLVNLLKSAKTHLNKMDQIMRKPESVERGKEVAHEMNRFNFDLDSFLHFDCNVPLNRLQTILNKNFKL